MFYMCESKAYFVQFSVKKQTPLAKKSVQNNTFFSSEVEAYIKIEPFKSIG